MVSAIYQASGKMKVVRDSGAQGVTWSITKPEKKEEKAYKYLVHEVAVYWEGNVSEKQNSASTKHLLDSFALRHVPISQINPYESRQSLSEEQKRFHTFQEDHARKVIIVPYEEQENIIQGNL
jgi:hypothetical protein